MRLVALLVLTPGALTCGGDDDATTPDPTKPTVAGTLNAVSAELRWTWTEETDASDLVITRDGIAEPQREIDPTLRSWLVPVDGAREIELAIQACRKHTLGRSTCGGWSSASVHR